MAVGDAHAGLRGPVELNASIGDFTEIKVKSGRLSDIVTRTLVPSVCLHITLLSSIYLFKRSEGQFFAMLPFFLLALSILILHRVFKGRGEDVIVSSRQSVAIFCFLFLSAAGASTTARGRLSDNENALFVGLFLVACFGVIAFMCLKRRIEPLGMVVIVTYCVTFFIIFGKINNFFTMLALALPCLVAAALVLVLLRQKTYMLGVAFAGLVTIVLGVISRHDEGAVVVLATGLMLLVPFFMYQKNASQIGYSDLLRFLALSIAAAILCISIAEFRPSEEGTGFFIAASLFGIYTGVAWRHVATEGRPIQLAWLAILFSMSVISLDTYDIVFALCSASLLTVSLIYGNEFVRILAGACSGVGLWVVVHRLKEAVDHLFANGGENTSVSAAALYPSIGFLFSLAIALVSISLVISYYRLPPQGRPWWHGLLKKRHAATLRQIFRTVQSKLKDIPVVGWVYGVLDATHKSLRFAKGDGTSVSKYDILQITALTGATLATTYYLTPIVFNHIETIEDRIGWSRFVAVLMSWLMCGILLAVWGSFARSLFHTILALVFFSAPLLSHIFGQALFSPTPASGSYVTVMLMFWACPLFLVSLLPIRKRTPRISRLPNMN